MRRTRLTAWLESRTVGGAAEAEADEAAVPDVVFASSFVSTRSFACKLLVLSATAKPSRNPTHMYVMRRKCHVFKYSLAPRTTPNQRPIATRVAFCLPAINQTFPDVCRFIAFKIAFFLEINEKIWQKRYKSAPDLELFFDEMHDAFESFIPPCRAFKWTEVEIDSYNE